MYDLIIIGLGPSGINASIYAKRSNLNVLVIERGMPGGTLHNIKKVENYLGYEQIEGSALAMQFYKQFKTLNVSMVNEEVTDIIDSEIKTVITKQNKYQSKAIIISTGRGPLKLDLPNNDLPGISYCVLCDGSLYKDKIVALYGNKPEVLEDAIYLSPIVKKLYLICNNDRLIGSKDLVSKVNDLPNIEILFKEKITQINGDKKLESIKLNVNNIEINGLFINNEYGPLTSFCKNLNILDDHNYILVNEKGETNLKGIFACGDATKKDIYQIITAASEGATCAINAYKYIKGIN
jgi:thioredoxin reductase (NADPH)